jgi:hypothetical protein
MQQRRLRLGDILDDYCPRERRITNHVVVAMIEDDVRQTRCSTCDAEHEYKQAKAPSPRRKKSGALSQDALEDARPRAVAAVHTPEDGDDAPDAPDDFDAVVPDTALPSDAGPVPIEAAPAADAGDQDISEDDRRGEDDGPVHRRLIRATLPRPEGQAPEWKEPEFTMRQPSRGEANGNRPGGHRARGGHRPMRQAQGQPGGQNRFGGPRHGTGAPRHGSGAPHGSGQGQGQGRQGNRPGQPASNRGGSGRPPGQNRGPGRKRGR